MSTPRRLVLLADRSIADVDALPGLAQWLVTQAADHITVIAPLRVSAIAWLTGDTAADEADAQRRLLELREALSSHDVSVSGGVADEDPVGSVVAAVAAEPVDAVVVLRPHDDDLSWRERNLTERLREQLAVPVIEVIIGADGTVSEQRPVAPDAPGGSV